MLIVFNKSTGRVAQVVKGAYGDTSAYEDDSRGVVEVDENSDLDFEHLYVSGNEFVSTPKQPSPHHEWDWTTKSWLPNLDAAREAKLQQVAAELNRRLYLPCNDFDADRVSRDRISGTIARLQRGDGLPAGWIGWRDASNQQQWAEDDAMTVLANLTTLSRAIEDREQALLATSWQHKANIASLTTIEDIMNYNVEEGWDG